MVDKITSNELRVYFALVLGEVVAPSTRLPHTKFTDPASRRRMLHSINSDKSLQFTVAQVIRWEYVLASADRKHVTALWGLTNQPPPEFLPNLGKNVDRRLVECIFRGYPESQRETATGVAEIYGVKMHGLNAMDVAVCVENYPVADALLELDVQPTPRFWHFLLETAHTTPEYTGRVAYVASRVQPGWEDLIVAVKADNPAFTRILVSELALDSATDQQRRKVIEAAQKQFAAAVKTSAKSLRDSISGPKGKLTLLSAELDEVKRHLTRDPTNKYYTGRRDSIPVEKQRLSVQNAAYIECFKHPDVCRESGVLDTPLVRTSRAVLDAVR